MTEKDQATLPGTDPDVLTRDILENICGRPRTNSAEASTRRTTKTPSSDCKNSPLRA
jgi:hypothetical protein